MALYEAFDEAENGGASKDGERVGQKTFVREERTKVMQWCRYLQRAIAAGEELIVKWGTVGVKGGVSKALGFGDPKGTRLPLKGGLPDGSWKEFEGAFEELGRIESRLEKVRFSDDFD